MGTKTTVPATPTTFRRVTAAERAHSLRWRRTKEALGKLLVLLILSVLGCVFALPLYWMLSTSLKADVQVFAYPPVWIPNPVKWENYLRTVKVIPFALYARNTLTICILSLIGQVVSSSLVGYGFARIRWPGREVAFLLILSTMMLPYQVTMIPLYIIYRKLHWINTFRPLIVPSFFGSAFYIFLFRQFFRGIPNELSDAARIDGCNEFGIYRRIIVPLSRPVVATVALFDFLWNWNDFQGPLIYLQDDKKYTLSVGLQSFGGYFHNMDASLLMAAASIVVLPAIAVFFVAQATFIQGITLTGIKG